PPDAVVRPVSPPPRATSRSLSAVRVPYPTNDTLGYQHASDCEACQRSIRLEHQSGESGRQGTPPAALELTGDELARVLRTAIQRQGATPPAGEVTTPADALEIARQLNIPEAEGMAAAEAPRREKELAALRPQRRAAVRAGRRNAFFAALVGCGVLGGIVTALSGIVLWLILGLALAAIACFRWLFVPISDAEADRVELMPVARGCRVRGKAAITPRAAVCG